MTKIDKSQLMKIANRLRYELGINPKQAVKFAYVVLRGGQTSFTKIGKKSAGEVRTANVVKVTGMNFFTGLMQYTENIEGFAEPQIRSFYAPKLCA